MAIDDNTVYGLTGAQVKELPGKIEAVKGLARELTTADYNWPTSNPTEVALWLLEPGMYEIPSSGVTVRISANQFVSKGLVIVSPKYLNGIVAELWLNPGSVSQLYVVSSNGVNQDTPASIIAPVDNLTSTSATEPLSANQGRALKSLIDAIVVPTKTSDLTNDSDFVTSTEMDTALADKADTNDIPTALSELTNDINAVSDANYVHTDNNYTTVEKTKLAGITAGAEANTIDTVKVNGTALAPDANKAVDISVPTAVSELTNDSGFTSNVGTITGVSANGTSVATAGVANIPSATTSRYGVTQLSSSTSSTSTTLAATPSAVRSAYNLANGKATITMSTTDPGEGSALATNNFIAVYGDNKITLDEIDTTTFYDVLFNDASGQSSTITLSASAANYTRLKIFFRTNDTEYGFVEVYSPNGKYVHLLSGGAFDSSATYYLKARDIYINGTSISQRVSGTSYKEVRLESGSVAAVSTSNYISITRVEGWKF